MTADPLVLARVARRPGGASARLRRRVAGSLAAHAAAAFLLVLAASGSAGWGAVAAAVWLATHVARVLVMAWLGRRGRVTLADGVVSCREYRRTVRVPVGELRGAVRIPVAYTAVHLTVLLDEAGRTRVRLVEARWGADGVAALVARLGLPVTVLPYALPTREIAVRYPGTFPERVTTPIRRVVTLALVVGAVLGVRYLS